MILRVFPAAWGIGDKYTSAQANGMDINATHALDKRAGQTDILASIVTLGGAGRVIQAPAVGPNADTTWLVDSPNRVVILQSTISADRIYSLSATGALDGDSITFYSDGTFTNTITVKDQSAVTIGGVGVNSSTGSSWAEFMFKGGAWKQMRAAGGMLAVTVEFLVSGNLVIPSNALNIGLHRGWGSGSSGGSGACSGIGASGGGGGGAAVAEEGLVQIVPGTTYAVTIGASVAGATASTSGAGRAGAAGLPTSMGTLKTYSGARVPGFGGIQDTAPSVMSVTRGGSPGQGVELSRFHVDANSIGFLDVGPACGGFGTNSLIVSSGLGAGGRNPVGNFAGGARGNKGLDGTSDPNNPPGGPGGGGAAGPGGAGGTGGNGGNSVISTGSSSTLQGQPGTTPVANSGAGGAGGGGAGANVGDGSYEGGGLGGVGTASGSGYFRFTYFIP